MGLLHYLWSRTAASNATADAQINWAEGMAPSAVNDSARAMMASLAGYRDDIAGAIATGGTSTAYTVTSYQIFDTLAHMSGQIIAFTPHTTSGAAPTLNVDSLGAKPLQQFPSTDMPAGVLVQGTPYVALYNNSDAVWYLQGSYVNPYQVPLGGAIEYFGTSAPNSAFAIPNGQAISRTTYATLFSLIGTTYGTGNGSTTFNIPDLRGRVSAMKEDAATNLTSTYFGGDSTAMGATGGGESKTLATSNMPPYTPAGTLSMNVPTSGGNGMVGVTSVATGTAFTASGGQFTYQTTQYIAFPASTGTFTGTAQGGTSAPFRTVQPTIIVNKIIRII